jgi:hypothetical protein
MLKWPNRVEISLQEHQPSVEWNDGGRIWWLSADGTAYIQHGIQSDLTQVTSADPILNLDGNANDPVIDPGLLSAVDVLSKHMPEVSSWQFDPDHGLSFDDVRGWQAYFGEGGDMRMKVRIYNTIAWKINTHHFTQWSERISGNDSRFGRDDFRRVGYRHEQNLHARGTFHA